MSTSEVPYTVVTVECPNCKTEQTVHVDARVAAGRIGNQTIPCITCRNYFVVMAANKIVAGPFPKR